MKKRLEGCDFVRAICALGIAMFHFFLESNSSLQKSVYLPNGIWGSTLVTVFFVLSGAMLYYNHKEIPSIKVFYYKRWKSLFPMFYLAFSFFFIKNVLEYGTLFYRKNMILTIFGMDGYFAYRAENYYILGEWFLGAIILLYILYPVILKAFQKSWYIVTALTGILYIWIFFVDIFVITDFRNLISCLFSFEVGMLMMKFKERGIDEKKVFWGALILTGVFLCVSLPVNDNIGNHLLGFSLFIVLYYLGEKIMKGPAWITSSVKEISKLSYAIFLVHHVIECKILVFRNPIGVGKSLILFLITFIMIICAAKCLLIISNAILTSKYYKKCEEFLIHRK